MNHLKLIFKDKGMPSIIQYYLGEVMKLLTNMK